MASENDDSMKRRSLLKAGAAATAFGVTVPSVQAQRNGLSKQLSGAKAIYEVESTRKEEGETSHSKTRRIEVTISDHDKEGMVVLHTEIFNNGALEQKGEYSTHVSRILSPVSGKVTKRGPVEITSENGVITNIKRNAEETGTQSSLEVSLVDSSGLLTVGEGLALHLLPTFIGMFGGTPVVQPRTN